MRLYYCLWQFFLYHYLKKKIDISKIDIFHHLTFGNYWLPSFLYSFRKPFVWGPLGGAESTPDLFLPKLSIKDKTYEFARSFFQELSNRSIPTKKCATLSAVVLSKSFETRDAIQKIGSNKVKVFPEAGLYKEELNSLISNTEKNTRNEKEFNLISVGRLIHIKGFDLALEAFSKYNKLNMKSKYYILGEGPEFNKLDEIVKKNNLENHVIFTGNVTRHEVFNYLAKSDVLLHPSLHDSGGWVCLEAMACSCPVICLNIGGPAVQVTNETGFVLTADSPTQVVNDIFKKLTILSNDRNLHNKMKLACVKHIEENYLWDIKLDQINRIYQEIL